MSLNYVKDNIYELVGDLNEDDVEQINKMSGCVIQTPSIINLPPNLLAQIKDNGARRFSIYDCFNYKAKPKYTNPKDIEMYAIYYPNELGLIVNNIKKLTSRVDPSWSATKKAMFCAVALAREIEYEHKYENQAYRFDPNTGRNVIQSLRCINHGKGVCVGYAFVYAAMLESLGVEVEYQQNDKHAWNVFKDEKGRRIPIDVTWISTNLMDPKASTNDAMFNFGCDKNFYSHPLHNIVGMDEDGTTDIDYLEMNAEFKKMFAEVNRALKTSEYVMKMGGVPGASFMFTEYPEVPTDGYGFKAYVVNFEGKVTLFYAQDNVDLSKLTLDEVKTALDKNLGFVGDKAVFQFYKSKLKIPSQQIERDTDGNVFVYNMENNHVSGVNSYKTLQVVGGKLVSNIVYSKDNLTNVQEHRVKQVGNSILSKDNIDNSVGIGGYVGELGKSGHTFDLGVKDQLVDWETLK